MNESTKQAFPFLAPRWFWRNRLAASERQVLILWGIAASVVVVSAGLLAMAAPLVGWPLWAGPALVIGALGVVGAGTIATAWLLLKTGAIPDPAATLQDEPEQSWSSRPEKRPD